MGVPQQCCWTGYATNEKLKRMNKYIFLTFLLINSLTLSSQTHQIDSLKNVLSSHPEKDSIRIGILNKIAYKFFRVDPEKALIYANEAQEISENLNLKGGLAQTSHVYGVYYLLKGESDSAIIRFKYAAKVNKERGYIKGMIANLINVAITEFNRGNYTIALENYQKTLKLTEEINDIKQSSLIYINMGNLFYKQSNYPKAYDYYQKALKINEDLGIKEKIAFCLNNIGSLLIEQGEYQKALEYLQNALQIKEELEDTKGIASTFSNIGAVYLNLKKYNKAFEYFQYSFKSKEALGDKAAIPSSLINIGKIHSAQENYHKAIKILERAFNLSNEIRDKEGICVASYNLGIQYFKIGKIKKALTYSNKALEIAKELVLLENSKDIYQLLSEIYASSNNFKKAYNNYLLYKELNDSIFNEKNIRKIANLEYQYKFDKEKTVLEEEQKRKELKHEKEKAEQIALRNSFFVGFLFLLVVSVLIFIGFRKNQKKNKELAKLNNEIETHKELILSQNEELTTANERLIELDQFKEVMTGMIIHDLKNPLNTIINSNPSIDSKFPERVKNSGKQMLNLMLNILDLQKYKNSTMKVDIQQEKLSNIFDKAIEEVNFLCEEKNIDILIETNELLTISSDKEIIHRALVNLLTNAIKYSPINDKIHLRSVIIPHQSRIRIEVCDNGLGIPLEEQKNIFERFAQQQAKDSGHVQSTGLGLAFCKMAVDAHGGEIGVESDLNNGSCFWFTLDIGKSISNSDLNIIKTQESSNLPKLTKEEINQISKTLEKLNNTKIYQISKLKMILKEVDEGVSDNIKQWKNMVEKAISTEDQEKFNTLINYSFE